MAEIAYHDPGTAGDIHPEAQTFTAMLYENRPEQRISNVGKPPTTRTNLLRNSGFHLFVAGVHARIHCLSKSAGDSMHPTQQPNRPIVALTSIRFFAALTVAIGHYTQMGLLGLPAAIEDGGRPAVSLFFVLSGFVLAYNYHGSIGRTGVSRFYLARFARIYPVMLLSLGLAASVTVYMLGQHDTELLYGWYAIKSHPGISLTLSLVAQLLLLTAWLPIARMNQPWNGPAWSISCEAFYYAMFPWLLLKLLKMPNRSIALACLAAWCLEGVWIFFALNYLPTERSGFVVSQFPISHLAEFFMGAGAALWFVRARAKGYSRHRLGVVLVCLALIAFPCIAAYHAPALIFFLETPLFVALILGLALLERPVLGLLNRRPLVLLGEASFSLYLIHVPLAHWAYIAGFTRDDGWIALVIAVALSTVIFVSFEKPMRRRILQGARPAEFEPIGLRGSAIRLPPNTRPVEDI
ncbi:acyltransferase family protein [Trinickia sp. EG282A]|uniref:acyltransferase family protein n=1 Tax=Trinickia sp. EG282A TaxID=3237013 RepID=UPI0034D26A64